MASDVEMNTFVRTLRRLVCVTVALWMVAADASAAPAAEGGAAEKSPIVSRIVIDITHRYGDPTPYERLARDLIVVPEAQPLSIERLQASLAALKASGVFAKIDVPDPDWRKDRIDLVFLLTPYRRIRKIQIEGAFPILEREVLNVIGIKPGDAFTQKRLDRSRADLLRMIEKEGYVSPKVEFKIVGDGQGEGVILKVIISKGPYFTVEEVRIDGNTAVSDARLKLAMKSWKPFFVPDRFNRYRESVLENDIDDLLRLYRKKGYADVRIDRSIEKDPETRTVDIRLSIDEGPRYAVNFVGNEMLSDRALKKEITLFDEGNVNDFGLAKSIRNLREKYRSEGFLDATVKYDMKTAANENVRTIEYRIDEGNRSLVEKLEIRGNQAFSDDRIKKRMLIEPHGLLNSGAYVPGVLEEDLDAVAALYAENGYLKTEVADRTEFRMEPGRPIRWVDVTVAIEEGVQTRISEIAIEGLTVASEAAAYEKLGLKKDQPYREQAVQEGEIALGALVSEKGYPHVLVKSDTAFSPDRSRVRITYTVNPGPFTKMDHVYITGNFITQRKVFDNQIALAPGEPFSLKEMLETQKNIRNMNALESADFKMPGLEEKEETVTMVVNVQEKRPYYLQFGAGYDSERHLFTNLLIGDRNFLGLNKETWGQVEYSEIGYHSELGFVEPGLLGTRIRLTANLFAEEQEGFNQDFGIRTQGASVTFGRDLPHNMTGNLSFTFNRRQQYLRSDTADIDVRDVDLDPRTVFTVMPSLEYNTTDSFINPRKGLFSRFSVEASQGIQSTVDDFLKYRIDAKYYRTPVNPLTLAMRASVGYIDAYGGSDLVPEDQLFYLGGLSSVRGFDENKLRVDSEDNALGGRLSILGGLEARIGIGRNFQLAPFFDIGSIRDAQQPFGTDDFRKSVGLAVRYLTPVGPVGIAYGHKLDRMDGEDAGRFHFMFGYSF